MFEYEYVVVVTNVNGCSQEADVLGDMEEAKALKNELLTFDDVASVKITERISK